MTDLTDDDLKALAQWDTPTICNALEVAAPERRGHGYTVVPFSCIDPTLPPMVGYARTVKMRAGSPDLSGPKTMADRIPYFEYIAGGPQPSIIVVEDLDPRPGTGAYWGEVQTTVHKGLGALGAITNGSYRDVDDSAPGFQMLGGMVNPSHAWVRAVDFDCPVSIHGMQVVTGDIIHADRHGAVVVPADVVKAIPDAVAAISRKEAVILDAARADGFNIDKLKHAIGEQAEIH